MRRDIITTLCMDVVGNAQLRACPHPSTAVWEEPEPPPSERESAPHASRSDAHGALVSLFCQAIRLGGRSYFLLEACNLREVTNLGGLDRGLSGTLEAVDAGRCLRDLDAGEVGCLL